MKLHFQFSSTVFPLMSAPGAYIILKVEGVALIGGRRLKEGGAYFQVWRVIHMKFENLVIVSFLIAVKSNHYGI